MPNKSGWAAALSETRRLIGICKEITEYRREPVMPSENKSFYFFFKENMKSLGLPAPETLFGNLTTATSNITAIVVVAEKYGAGITIAELVGAGLLSEKLIIIGTCGAAFYVGACIGSLSVATGRSLSGGMSIADLFYCAKRHNIPTSPQLHKTFIAYPELCNADLRSSAKIAFRKAQWAKMVT